LMLKIVSVGLKANTNVWIFEAKALGHRS